MRLTTTKLKGICGMNVGTARSGRVIMLALLGACVLAAPADARPGDLNNNNAVDTGDVALALQIAGGLTNAFGYLAKGDVAGPSGNTPDGKIDLRDVTRISRAANGLDDLGGGNAAYMVGIGALVTVAGNTVKNVQLPVGYQLTGTVKDTSGASITSAPGLNSTSGGLSFTNTANAAASGSGAVAQDASYTSILPQGLNTAKVITNVTSFDMSTFKFKVYSVVQTPTPASVAMTQNGTQAFIRPDLPATGTLSGNLITPGVALNYVNFSLANGGSGYTTPDGATYAITVPPGEGHVSVSGPLVSDSNVYVNAQFNGDALTVASNGTTNYDITLPTMATLHGVVTPPSGTSISSAFIGTMGDPSATHYGSSSNMTVAPNNYKLAIPPGSCLLSFMTSATTSGTGNVSWIYSTELTVPAGDSTKDVTLPALPATVNLSGLITGPDGNPVASAEIGIYRMNGSLTGWSPSVDAKSGPDGHYSVRVPAGDYGMVVSPPTS